MDLKIHENQPNLSPPAPLAGSHAPQRRGDDLPPSARHDHNSVLSSPNSNHQKSHWSGWILGLIATAAVAAVVILNPLGSPSDQESGSDNWSHVSAATQSDQGMKWVGIDGAMMLTNQVYFGAEDLDSQTTDAIRQALVAGDDSTADVLFAQAQSSQVKASSVGLSPRANGAVGNDPIANDQPASAPIVSTDPSASLVAAKVAPTLTPGLRAEILRGDTSFYHIHLSDSCYDDGDVVEILINGQPFFIVPITNAGATLSVPITSGTATVISVRGVYDGGGGITVACRSSQGEGFVRVMTVGEIQPLGVTIR